MPSPEFDAAVTRSKTLPKQDNMTLLKLYALFKQATKGDVTGKRPGRFDIRARAKFDAWTMAKGLSQAEAEEQYIALVDELAG